MDPPLVVEQGHLVLPDAPGIGTKLVLSEVAKHLAE
jgi:hypothetical protein